MFLPPMIIAKTNNTLSGPANCKTTRDHVHLSLCAKSRKTKDTKSRKWPKNLIWAIFDDFEVTYLHIAIFSEIKVSFKLKVIFSTNFTPKTKKKSLEPFLRKISVSDFGLIWRPFHEYLQIKIFFTKSGCDFSTFIVH